MSRQIDKDLLDACKVRAIDTVEKLIKEGANVNVKCTYYWDREKTPLHVAAGNGDEAVSSALLSNGGDPKAVDQYGGTPLHLAAKHGHEPVVATLIAKGGDPNMADQWGETPLHLAARNGHEPVVSTLIAYEGDPNVAGKDGNTPLHEAAKNGHETVVLALLSNGANPDVTYYLGNTPVHSAVENDQESAVIALLSHGADPNLTNKRGRTSLHIAAAIGTESTVATLFSSGADPYVTDVQRNTPLHTAAENGQEAVVLALLSHGADPNLTNKGGATPLHLAVRNGHKSVVTALLFNGGDPNVTDTYGATPYDIAKSSGQRDLCKLMREAEKLPRELQYLSMQDETTFAATLKTGHYYSHVGKLMCVGPEGVGKTAIVSVLRDVKPSQTRNCTEGIDLHTYKAAINMDKMEWVPSELKAEDVAFRDLVLEPKRNAQAFNTEQDDDDFHCHDLEVLKTEHDYKGASPLCDIEESTEEKISKETEEQRTHQKSKRTFLKTVKQVLKMESKGGISISELLDSAKRRSMKGLLERALAPVNMMDFGGQAAFYSTHQSFLTYRGLYILVIDGSKDFDAVIDTEDFIPGRHGKPTSRDFTYFWVSSIQAYSKGGSKYFPKILVVCTHRDKVPSNEADKRAEKIFHEIEKMFKNTPAEQHLILKPRIFLNAMDPADPGYKTLKEVLVQQICSQPSWGEKLPKAWIPLKMIINQKVEEGKMIMTLDELQTINEENPVKVLSREELTTFLNIHHAQGEIIYFPIKGLRDYIIISPEFLVDALRSLVTDKRFCQGHRMRTLDSMNQSGVLCHRDIEYIWKGKKRLMNYKHYLLSLFRHLDIIATPRYYGPDGALQDSNIYYVPCLVNGVVDTRDLEFKFKRRFTGLSLRFESNILPPAVGYRLMASYIDMYPIQKHNERIMLFSGMVVLCVNRKIDLLIILRSDRIDFYLIHEKSKDDIPKPIATSTLECVKDILMNILESYRKMSSEGKYTLSVPFQVEFPCYNISSPCYDTDRTRSSPKCKHDHTLSLQEKEKWFTNAKKEPIKAPARNECLSVGVSPLELTKKPTDRQLANISCQMMGEEMYNLVVQLGLKKYEIDNIKVDNRDDLMNIKFLLLRKWKQKTNGTIQDLVKVAAENEDISLEGIYQMNRDKPIPDGINVSDKRLSDEILDSVANKVINESLLFSVYLGLEASFWIRLKKDRYDIYEINREVLKKWRRSGENGMKDLVQALCNVDNIEALSLDT